MSARRRRMSGEQEQGGTPAVLTAAGVSDPLWESPERVEAWCARRGLPVPSVMYRDSPRAMRDACAVSWSVRHFPSRWPGLPDWGAAGRAGVSPISSARMVARRQSAVQQ